MHQDHDDSGVHVVRSRLLDLSAHLQAERVVILMGSLHLPDEVLVSD